MNISTKREYLSTLRLRYKLATSRKEKSAIINEVVGIFRLLGKVPYGH